MRPVISNWPKFAPTLSYIHHGLFESPQVYIEKSVTLVSIAFSIHHGWFLIQTHPCLPTPPCTVVTAGPSWSQQRTAPYYGVDSSFCIRLQSLNTHIHYATRSHALGLILSFFLSFFTCSFSYIIFNLFCSFTWKKQKAELTIKVIFSPEGVGRL